jgi:hypothetical protein
MHLAQFSKKHTAPQVSPTTSGYQGLNVHQLWEFASREQILGFSSRLQPSQERWPKKRLLP